MWYVYVLRSLKDGDLYIGLTNDLKQRLGLHNKGAVYSTKQRRPFCVIYYEAHMNKRDAAGREQFLKTGWGRGWIKRTMRYYLASKS